MKASEAFSVPEEQAEELEELKDTFKDKSDLRAALEDYFHVYDDFAEMSEDEFDERFQKFTQDVKDSEIESAVNKELKSSTIGNIKDAFCLGRIKEPEALKQLTDAGKGKREAKKIIDKWKENGIVKSSRNIKSSVDSVADDIADYFGTEAGEDNVIECDDIITHKDVDYINDLIEDDEDVKVKIGTYSVTVDEAPEITNAVDLSVEEDEDNVTVSIEKPDEDNIVEDETEESQEEMPSETSFVKINSEEDFENYGVQLPEGYEFEDVKGKWWEIDGTDGSTMEEVIEQEGDEEVFIVIDNDRVFFDTAHNYLLDSDAEAEDYGLSDDDFEEGEYEGD